MQNKKNHLAVFEPEYFQSMSDSTSMQTRNGSPNHILNV